MVAAAVDYQYAFGGEGGSRTHVRNTFSRQFTTINQLEIVALFVRLMTFVAVQCEPYIAHWS